MTTGTLTFYDSAWPPAAAPQTDGVCVYVGGDTLHVWTPPEIQAQKARYRLPVFVRSNPRGIAGVASDVNAALTQLAVIGAPKGILVAWDMETAVDSFYVAGVYTGMLAHGYKLIVYGSDSTVFGNAVPDGLYFAADWTGHAHLAGGSAITQWVSFAGYDLDLAQSALPFWDTHAGPPKPPAPVPSPVPAWQEDLMNQLPVLSVGAQDEPGHVFFVSRMKALLKVVGEIKGVADAAALTVNGSFDAETEVALKSVQTAYGITADGICGSKQTWPVLLTGAA